MTPKKSTGLNQDYVELKAVGVDTATFNQFLEWEGGEVGTAPDKRKVKRDATGLTEVKIKVKQGGAVAAQMDVWVVWTTVTATNGTASFVQDTTWADYRIQDGGTGQWRFVFQIQPTQIISGALELRWTRNSGHGKAKLSYGGGVPGRCRGSLVWDQG